MTSRRSFRSLLGAMAVALGMLAGPLVVHAVGAHADGVDDAQRKVDQILDELDNLRNQMGQIDEDYSAALDRQDQLAIEITASQARIDELTIQLGDVEGVLQQIAVARFTGGDSLSLSPIFSDAATYSQAEQRVALGLVAIDTGESDIDGLQSLVDDLAAERASLERKQQEAASLIATLEQKQKDYTELETAYLAKEAQARADLGQEKLAAAEEARAAAAAEQQARNSEQAAASAAAATPAAPRGGGGDTGGGNTGGGGGDTGGGNTGGGGDTGGSPAPAVSGKAGIAVSAAYSQLGVPYRFATSSPGVSFDCSGLTKWAWGRAGVGMPHQSGAQYGSFPHVSKDEAQPGDLIFYYSPIGHVGIYIGGGQMIHAPQTGDVVKISVVHWNKVVGVARPG
ncbi:MAG: C40 family peptidase [Acidimicrobiaceae bacterium]|jgi:cell wall-associated NlpC family hydrolase|nr:C40 family peptidase [Acidimicrobiaceae bacterium]